MKRFTSFTLSLIAVFSLLFVPLVPSPVGAQTPKEQLCKGINQGSGCSETGTNNFRAVLRTIVNLLLFLVGAVAVIMLIVGGFKYVVSGGDSSSTKSAKDTILYAIIGIVVAFAAYAIVNFVALKI